MESLDHAPGTPLALVMVMSNRLLHRLAVLVRSMGVGVFATGTDLGVLALLVSGLGWSPRAASLPALLLGIVVQFLGNKLLAFDDRRPEWLRQGAQFMAVEAVGFVANLLLFDRAIALTHLPYLPVRLVTTSFVYFAICLPLWTRIFRTGARPLQGEAS